MNNLSVLIGLILLTGTIFSQGLLNNGARITMQAGSNIVIAGNGNWTNNGLVSCNTASTVHFAGSANQTILGTNTTAFGNLTVNNTGGDVIVGRDISVLSTLQMNNGDFDLKDFDVNLGTTGSLNNEASARRIKATDGGGFDGQGGGTIFTIRTNPSGNVAGLGLNITPAGNMGVTTLVRGHEVQSGSGTFSANGSVFRYYEIQPTTYQNNSFVFNYYPAWELNGHIDGTLIAFQEVQYMWNGWTGPIYWEPLTTVNGSPSATATTVTTVLQSNVRLTLGSQATPLPVELISFKTECKDNMVLLNWMTASEVNNDYFDIERSYDGYSFSSIGIIYGAGSANQVTTYNYLDDQYEGQSAYYRLKQVDFNGQFTYSEVISVNCGIDPEPEINIYSPVNNENLVLSFTNNSYNQYTVLITDKLGRQVVFKEILLDAPTQVVKIDKTNLSAGLYNVTIYNNAMILSKQILIAHSF